MAGDWVAACKDLPDKPEVIFIANATGAARLDVAAFLVWKFWAWADGQSADGTLPGITVGNLEEMFGRPASFWKAMQGVGWLDIEPGGLRIPNFCRWMGKSAKARLVKNARQARWRAPGDAGKEASTKAPTREPNRTVVGEESPTTPLARTSADAEPGPEPAATAAPGRQSASPAAASPPAPGTDPHGHAGAPGPAADADPVVLTFPAVGRGAAEWHLRASKLAEYRGSFPAVDVLAECRRALQWLRDNPRNRKTAQGMARYLGNWLGKEQNRARPAPGANGAHRPARDPVANVRKAFNAKEQRT